MDINSIHDDIVMKVSQLAASVNSYIVGYMSTYNIDSISFEDINSQDVFMSTMGDRVATVGLTDDNVAIISYHGDDNLLKDIFVTDCTDYECLTGVYDNLTDISKETMIAYIIEYHGITGSELVDTMKRVSDGGIDFEMEVYLAHKDGKLIEFIPKDIKDSDEFQQFLVDANDETKLESMIVGRYISFNEGIIANNDEKIGDVSGMVSYGLL